MNCYDNRFETIEQKFVVPADANGSRLDLVLCQLMPDYSRSQIQKWLESGKITVNGKAYCKRKMPLSGNEQIHVNVTLASQTHWKAEPMELPIIYEDQAVLCLNKPAGWVVHPGAGNLTGTISNGLLAYDSNFETLPRAGIVHRLDKETSGLMVVAKTLPAYQSLVKQLAKRTVKRTYEAIATGELISGQTISAPIGRDPHNRLRMAVTPTGKNATTHMDVLERFMGFTRVRCQLDTGRTHQIRVHMKHIRAPLVGDSIYNPRVSLPKGNDESLRALLQNFKRQALHARELCFTHPISGKTMSFKAKPPEDYQTLLKALRDQNQAHLDQHAAFLNAEFEDEFFDDFDDEVENVWVRD